MTSVMQRTYFIVFRIIFTVSPTSFLSQRRGRTSELAMRGSPAAVVWRAGSLLRGQGQRAVGPGCYAALRRRGGEPLKWLRILVMSFKATSKPALITQACQSQLGARLPHAPRRRAASRGRHEFTQRPPRRLGGSAVARLGRTIPRVISRKRVTRLFPNQIEYLVPRWVTAVTRSFKIQRKWKACTIIDWKTSPNATTQTSVRCGCLPWLEITQVIGWCLGQIGNCNAATSRWLQRGTFFCVYDSTVNSSCIVNSKMIFPPSCFIQFLEFLDQFYSHACVNTREAWTHGNQPNAF